MRETKAILCFLCILFSFFNLSCQKEAGSQARLKPARPGQTEIDTRKIADLVGVPFRIFEEESIGFRPRHKFFWVSVSEKAARPAVEALANEIIKETIAQNPSAYQSFTIHFFYESKLQRDPGKSNPFARATFLPDGNWEKVGRTAIEDYQDYKLTFTYFK